MGCASSSGTTTAVVAIGPDWDGALDAHDFHSDYTLLERLGRGSFGSVYSAVEVCSKAGSTGAKLAVKVVDVRKDTSQALGLWGHRAIVDQRLLGAHMCEVRMMQKAAGHCNVCHIVASFTHGGLAYIVQTRCERTLVQALERLPAVNESTLQPFFRGMLRGLSFVHSRGIVHGDVKPDNFMCAGQQDTVKLVDFGLSRLLSPTLSEGCAGACGTPPYMCPEMIVQKRFGAKADAWSFGVSAYVLCFGLFPYKSRSSAAVDVQRAIVEGTPAPSFSPLDSGEPSGLSKVMLRWMRHLLARDPRKRLSCLEALEDEVFTSRVASTADLRPMLRAARQCGAFKLGDGGSARPAQDRIDERLRVLDERYHARRPTSYAWRSKGMTPSHPSEVTTDTGSTTSSSRQGLGPPAPAPDASTP